MKAVKGKIACKIIIFILLLAVFLGALSRLLKPVWLDWNNYDTQEGFYEQPENTIETLFLGSSVVVNGITPTELYEDYGICAYSLATQRQPVLASYYWLLEAYEYQGETLKTVVLEVSQIRSSSSDMAFYQKALMGMHFSERKLMAFKSCTDTLEDFLAWTFPVILYHSRWKELEETDFSILDYEVNSSLRGYQAAVSVRSLDAEPEFPAYLAESDEEQELNEEALYYLGEIAEFCEEHEIDLILMRTPTDTDDWSDAEHNAIQKAADEYEIEFLDFNYSPYVEEIDYNTVLDRVDSRHLNYSGASKLTAWFGEYLTENYGASDIRGDENYTFMEDELAEYKRSILLTELEAITEPCEYLETALAYEDYTVLICAAGNVSDELTEEQRAALERLGLTALSQEESAETYLAVLEDGEVVFEQSAADGKSAHTLQYEGRFADGTEYVLESKNDAASCSIDGQEYCEDGGETEGLYIIVYDTRYGEAEDSAFFPDGESLEREIANPALAYRILLESGTDPEELTGDYLAYYLMDLEYEDYKTAKRLRTQNAGPEDYLEAFSGSEYVISVSSDEEGQSFEIYNTLTEETVDCPVFDEYGARVD